MPPAAFIGDVHGDVRRLSAMVREIHQYCPNAAIYHLGDIIDRGPASKAVLELCIAEKIDGILGNHELWLREVCLGMPYDEFASYSVMGGIKTLASFGVSPGDPDHVGPALFSAMGSSVRSYILDLPPYRKVVVGDHVFWLVHAGLSSSNVIFLSDEDPEDILRRAFLQGGGLHNSSNAFFWRPTNFGDENRVARIPGATLVSGHVPIESPIVKMGHYIALDTGCSTCPPNILSAILIKEDGSHLLLSVS